MPTSREAKASYDQNSYADQINGLLDTIEVERGNLSKVESLLGCLAIAMEYGGSADRDPYFPDVAQIACEMIRKTINALDPIYLPDPGREKVKEGFGLFAGVSVAALQPTTTLVGALPAAPVSSLSVMRELRVHRRNYSRAVRCVNDSSAASASAKICG